MPHSGQLCLHLMCAHLQLLPQVAFAAAVSVTSGYMACLVSVRCELADTLQRYSQNTYKHALVG